MTRAWSCEGGILSLPLGLLIPVNHPGETRPRTTSTRLSRCRAGLSRPLSYCRESVEVGAPE
jgi:hypothetical protein